MDHHATTQPAATLEPVCFMIMPYGKKPSFSDKGPATINYDMLWDKVLLPVIEGLGYQAIRADQDMGALIINEMIERLTLADLVIAEVSTPNPNVYYEIGVRHAAKATGCVLISADWSKQNFDIEQMRQVRYPLPEGDITDDTANAARKKLEETVADKINGISPVFASVPGFPGKADPNRTTTFRKQVEELSKFSAEIRQIKLMPKDQRQSASEQLTNKYRKIAGIMPSIALELIYLLRDNTNWKEVVAFIDTLPNMIKQIPVVQEQRCLAQSKTGDHLQAIASLEQLIALSGDTSERRGLIGGRYKKLFTQTEDTKYLNLAIAEYDKGMRLDLNDYYPTCNLARLYRTRGRKGDEEKAKAAAVITVVACDRARKINPSDEWLLPTLLGAAFDAGDFVTAETLYDEMTSTGIQPFKLDTTMADLELSIKLQKDEATVAGLDKLLDDIRKLVN